MENQTQKKIAVLDFGGQYAHLIASRIRRLGTYTEIVFPEEFHSSQASEYAGLIYSGGPSSVYEEGAPISDPELLTAGVPVLGICYGHQLIMKQAGGDVRASNSREYGPALMRVRENIGIFDGQSEGSESTVWMSHGDEVAELPEGFSVIGSTDDCRYAAVGNQERKIYGIQFHPEVKDTQNGDEILFSFLQICGVENTWSLDRFLENEIELIRRTVNNRKVFMLISGGVDSTVAFALLSRALPADHLKGLFVDTGFMRSGEISEVKKSLENAGVEIESVDRSALFFDKLVGIHEPEKKRNIIGELFVDVQAEVSASMGLNPEEWFLGQGTIYPDTIESGSTKNSHKIKTHHNRVERIERMLEKGMVIEPLKELYKDEVRNLGRLLGLPDTIVERHPFPGPGLAVRTLCTGVIDTGEEMVHTGTTEGFDHFLHGEGSQEKKETEELVKEIRDRMVLPIVLPVQSVGVQGDKRSYAHPVALFPVSQDWKNIGDYRNLSRMIPNRITGVNRVVLCTGSRHDIRNYRVVLKSPAHLTGDRVDLLRAADRIVHEFQVEKGLYGKIWQFPVVLAPLYMRRYDDSVTGGSVPGGSESDLPESIILRPVTSLDAMTADYFRMERKLVEELSLRLLSLVRIDMIFYDITSKPPGTIEWE